MNVIYNVEWLRSRLNELDDFEQELLTALINPQTPEQKVMRQDYIDSTMQLDIEALQWRKGLDVFQNEFLLPLVNPQTPQEEASRQDYIDSTVTLDRDLDKLQQGVLLPLINPQTPEQEAVRQDYIAFIGALDLAEVLLRHDYWDECQHELLLGLEDDL